MALNLEYKGYHYFKNFLMLIKEDARSYLDCVGRTILAWIAYNKPVELEQGVEKCLKKVNGRWVLYRYPDHKERSSRDHMSYFIIYRKLVWDRDGLHDRNIWFPLFIKDIPFKRGLYLWMHALTGNKLAEWAYYTLYIPSALIGNIWLKLCRWVGRISKEMENKQWIMEYEFIEGIETIGNKHLKNRTKWQKLWAWIIFQTIPAYPLHNKAWQIYVMPESKKKEKLKRILLKRINTGCPCQSYGNSNIMLRLLFGDTTVTQVEINNYPHMTGYRPGVYLDETCRRTIRKMTEQESEYNCYEKDLIVWLYGKQAT